MFDHIKDEAYDHWVLGDDGEIIGEIARANIISEGDTGEGMNLTPAAVGHYSGVVRMFKRDETTRKVLIGEPERARIVDNYIENDKIRFKSRVAK